MRVKIRPFPLTLHVGLNTDIKTFFYVFYSGHVFLYLFNVFFLFCQRFSQCSTAVRTVVRATQQVNGKWPFSGCQNSVTSEPID